MNEQQWRQERDDRTLRYAERRLDPNRWITITTDPGYVSCYDGQVALIVVANLLARMTPAVAVDLPHVPIVAPLPWAGQDLSDFVLQQMHAADPFGRFSLALGRRDGYQLHVGPTESPLTVHGSGWDAYIGPGASPITASGAPNPFGAAFAAILAGAHVFASDFGTLKASSLVSTLTWTPTGTAPGAPHPTVDGALGTVWTVGVGSVGTAILYFTTLWTRNWSGGLFDMDEVKRHNLDRSPIFAEGDIDQPKVLATQRFLSNAGVQNVKVEAAALHEAAAWKHRQQGTPDLILAAANEYDVRYHIENGYPPLQIYGTTGRNWQATMVRHLPLDDACSCCLFPPPPNPTAQLQCATGSVPVPTTDELIDTALPFLSFAAGLMAAAEVAKLDLPDYPYSTNQVTLYTADGFRLSHTSLARRDGCICCERSDRVHAAMLAGSRYRHLSA